MLMIPDWCLVYNSTGKSCALKNGCFITHTFQRSLALISWRGGWEIYTATEKMEQLAMFLGTHISVGILWLMRSGTDPSMFMIKMQNAYPNSNDINFLRFRYIQAPLAYPRERKRRMNSEGWLPFCVYRDGFNPEIYPALWSDYYNKNKREPENTQLAPWVARHFAKYHKFHWPLLEFMFCQIGCCSSDQDGVGTCIYLEEKEILTFHLYMISFSHFYHRLLGKKVSACVEMYVLEIRIMCIRFFKAVPRR